VAFLPCRWFVFFSPADCKKKRQKKSHKTKKVLFLPKKAMATGYIPLEAGRFYHIYNRGIDKTNIFRNKDNYDYFLQLYARHCLCVVETYAYCLLANHFHLLVRVKDELPTYADLYPDLRPEQLTAKSKETVNPSKQFAHFFNAYTQGFNNSFKPKRTGGLFEEPFKRLLVDNDAYFSQLVQYIHLNPQKHGFVDDFTDYAYSSYHSFISKTPTKLAREAVLNWFGGSAAYKQFHRKETDEKLIEKWIIEFD
jgi:putative transposase